MPKSSLALLERVAKPARLVRSTLTLSSSKHADFFDDNPAGSFFAKVHAFNSLMRVPHTCFDMFVTPELAALLLEKHNYEHQRPLTRHAWELYAQSMREYKFGEYTTLKFAIQNITPILIDGQHRLRAIVASGVPMQFTVQLLKVANQAEIERAYSTIDSGKKRLPGDKMGAIDKELGLRRPDCKVLNSAVRVLLLGFKPLGPADPVELHIIAKDAEGLKGEMKLWAAAMHLMLACLARAPRANAHLFLRASVLAVALVTLRDQPEMAIRFWTAAAFDDGLRAGQPEKALLYWLRSNVVSLSPRLQHEAAIVCWNKFFQGKKLTTFHSGILRQTSIAGSPFKLRSFEAPADAA